MNFEKFIDPTKYVSDPDKLIELFTQLYSLFLKQNEQLSKLEKKYQELEKVNQVLKEENIRLKELNKQLNARVDQLESELAKYTSPNIPSSKVLYEGNKKPKNRSGLPKSPPRKRGGSKKNKSGITWDQKEPDERVNSYVDYCVKCGQEAKPEDQVLEYIKRILDIPEEIELKLYEYLVHKWKCHSCGSGNVAPPPTLSGTSLGINLLTLITTTRYRTGGSFDNLGDLIGDNTQINPSGTAIYRGYTSVADAIEEEAEKIKRVVMNADWIQGDETGHKLVDEKSKNVGSKKIWVWIFATPKAVAYFVESNRGHDAIDVALSYREEDKPPPACVCDVYGAYMNKFEPCQYCWAHLLRDSKDKEDHCLKCKMLHDHLVNQYKKIKELHTKLREEKRWDGVSSKIFDQAIEDFLSIFAEAPSDPDGSDVKPCKHFAKLRKRLLRHGNSYLTCLKDPRMPMTNNHAERLLKTVILHRGNGGKPLRSKKAMKQYGNILTVLTTWKLQNKPLAKTLREYLQNKINHPLLISN